MIGLLHSKSEVYDDNRKSDSSNFNFMSSFLVIGIFAFGLLLGHLIKKYKTIHRINERFTMVTVYLLLFLLGISVGVNDEIVGNMVAIGFKALFLSTGAMLGTLILAYLVVRLFFKEGPSGKQNSDYK